MKNTLDCTKYFLEDTPWVTGGEDTQYYIEKNNRTREVTVAFLGSNSKVDWKANFSFLKKPYKNMEVKFRVHGGFLKRWQAVRDEVMNKIEELNPSCITITGHSYGGAMALFCAEDCWFRFIKSREGQDNSLKGKIHCFTFGAPRILGFMNYKKIKERWEGTIELWNGSDLVTCVPPLWLLYRHPVRRTHIGDKYHWYMLFRPDIFHGIGGDKGYKSIIKKVEGDLE